MGLLFDEHPLLISPILAKELGNLNEAVFVQQLHYWLESKKQFGKNYYDGRYWVFNSYEEWVKQFPWMSVPTLRRTIDSLVKKEFVIKGNYNQKKMDHTIWYSLNYEKIMEINKKIKEQKDNNAKLALEAVQKKENQESAETLIQQTTERCDQNEQFDLPNSTERCDQNEQFDLPNSTERCDQNEQFDLPNSTERCDQIEQFDLPNSTERCDQIEQFDVIKMSRSMCSKRSDRCDQNDQSNTIDYPEINTETTTTSTTPARDDSLGNSVEDVDVVLNLYNKICPSFPPASTITPQRKSLIRALFRAGFDLESFKKVFQLAERSDFLSGRSQNASYDRFDFEWLLELSHFVHILEGKYDNISVAKQKRIDSKCKFFDEMSARSRQNVSATEEEINEFIPEFRNALHRHRQIENSIDDTQRGDAL